MSNPSWVRVEQEQHMDLGSHEHTLAHPLVNLPATPWFPLDRNSK